MSHKVIRDSVHGYIALDPVHLNIVDTAEFQRLKNIEQGSFRVLYPAARHDRFIHSLGVYHLARKVAGNFINNIKQDLDLDPSKDALDVILNSFYYAALLHDIGHAPFSHTTEKFFKDKKLESGYEFDSIAINESFLQTILSTKDKKQKDLFLNDFKEISHAPHEIISATILIQEADKFLGEEKNSIDLELAARMVIGCTFDYNSLDLVEDKDKTLFGVKNCFIRLLNSSTVDVDKLDYITRDAQMSGFNNIPIDIDRLIKAVTAIRNPDGWMYPAFRKTALSVIDNVFRAKTEEGIWMVAHPTVLYDSELLGYCINELKNLINDDYIQEVFSLEALGKEGVAFQDKEYHLLSDLDIHSDLKMFFKTDNLIREIYDRSLRRHAIWKSYYEYKYLFGQNDSVFLYFKGLIDYLTSLEKFVFNEELYNELIKDSEAQQKVIKAAEFLHGFCKEAGIKCDFVLLSTKNAFAPNFDPEQVYISFNKLPSSQSVNYASYKFLKDELLQPESVNLFYLYSGVRFDKDMLEDFRKKLFSQVAVAPRA